MLLAYIVASEQKEPCQRCRLQLPTVVAQTDSGGLKPNKQSGDTIGKMTCGSPGATRQVPNSHIVLFSLKGNTMANPWHLGEKAM